MRETDMVSDTLLAVRPSHGSFFCVDGLANFFLCFSRRLIESMRHDCLFLLVAFCCAIGGLTGVAGAQSLPTETKTELQVPAESSDPEIESLRQRAVKADLPDDEKQTIFDAITRIEKSRKDLRQAQKNDESYKAALAGIPRRVEKVKTEIAEAQSSEPTVPAEGTLAELETALATLSAKRASLRKSVEEAESSIKGAAQRRAELDAELSKLIASLDERQAQAVDADQATDGSLSAIALAMESESSLEQVKAQISALQSEKALLDAEIAANLPQLRRDQLASELELTGRAYEQLSKRIESMRVKDAEERVERASRDVYEMHPALQAIGQRNQELAALNQELTEEIEDADRKLEARNKTLEEVRTSIEQARERVESVGLTVAVGAMLRNLKQALPNVSAYRYQIRHRASEINDASYQLMEMTDQRNESLDGSVEELLSRSDVKIPPGQREVLQHDAKLLLQEQRSEYLDPAIQNQRRYFNTLFEISTKEEEIVKLTNRLEEYINENVLWTRSTLALTSHWVPGQSEWWFLQPSAWSRLVSRITEDVFSKWMLWLTAVTVLVVLIALRYRLRERISEIGEQVSGASTTNFAPTLQVLVLTVAASAPVPALFLFLGDRFISVAGEDRALSAVGQAFFSLAATYGLLEFVRHVCRPSGLAEAHFGWPPGVLRKVRRNLRLLLYIAVPLNGFATFLSAAAQGYGNDVLERYVKIGAMAVICWFLVRTMHPRRGAPAHYLAKHPGGWIDRLSSIWYPVLVASPVLLVLLSIIGYHFTSGQLGRRCFLSAGMLFAISIVVSLAMRWLIMHRRRLRIQQLREARLAHANEAGSEAELPISVTDQSVEDLHDQMLQSSRLFRTALIVAALIGFWIVWIDVIPAFRLFERWPLWSSTKTVTEYVTTAPGEIEPKVREIVEWITISDLALSVLILVICFAAARNLPGMLEFSVLTKLPLDRSIRYAITTLVSYAIFLVGIVIAGGTIGLHWNQIQWMATALTFGLAFGLQEMFANFVAGIIILFEQPVRVGDVVEIDGVTGIVSKIRIRATTITDWDRKDYIVPNKEFITGKLLNWTRSDEIVRLTVPVGIAYGSDTRLARDLLLQSAEEHPDVLKDPPTLATFEGFGDNSLSFMLRVFCRTYERRLQIGHELHMAIDQKFRDAGIEISFPQRDLHLRSVSQKLVDAFQSSRSEKTHTVAEPDFTRS
jgi:potassium efflux system protein